jgi:pimeloyl-ACP methyl ester carboxylesterase
MNDQRLTSSGSVPASRRGGTPAVVFVHGMRTSSHIWDAQLEHVRARGHDALAVDLPAHGALRDERFSMRRAYDVLDEAVASFGTDRRVALVGLSLGGYTTLAWTARRSARGQTADLAGVVAVGCSSDPKGKPVALYRALAHAAVTGTTVARRRSTAAATWWRSAVLGGRSRPGGADVQALIGGADDVGPFRPGWQVVTDSLSHLAGRSSVANLRATRVPVWLVNGARDRLRLEEHRHLQAAYRGALVVVPGAGHDVNTDAPEAFNRVLDRALHTFARP